MSAESNIKSPTFDISERIDKRVESILGSKPIVLPDANGDLVNDYIRKIEGTYDVSRSKKDTDHAVDLLYIAYNATPQEEGGIRTKISKLMDKVIKAQQDSKIAMYKASGLAKSLHKSITNLFLDWQIAKESEEDQELKDFISIDLLDQAKDITKKSNDICSALLEVANDYDTIISDASAATSLSENALSKRLKDKKEIQEDINKNSAEKAKIQSLITDLKASIKKYEKMAAEYKSQAETAEERAFIMSIVRVGAQMISDAIPAITAALTAGATGGTSVVAASANQTARQVMNSETALTEDDNTADVIKKKKEIAEKRAEKVDAENEKVELEEKVEDLEKEKTQVTEDEDTDQETKETKLESIDKRIESTNSEIKKLDAKITAANGVLEGLNNALKTLDKNMGEMAEKQENAAADLRKLQMQMIEKVEAYETEKRNQAAEMVKINALLLGKRTEEETIQLAIKSLNLSLKALKRMQEIIVELSFFFKSFAAFMGIIIEGSKDQTALIESATENDRLSRGLKRRIKRNTDDFFVTQVAEWKAVEIVSSKFEDNFENGWTKLNKLKGDYKNEEELKSYLKVAAAKIDEIAFERKQAYVAKMMDLKKYRNRIKSEIS